MSNRTSLIRSLAALALVCAAGAAQAQAYISGSISGQLAPGVYGQVNIGNAPPPLLYAQPMWGGPVVPQVQPIYMWVPPGHSRNWRRYCGRYTPAASRSISCAIRHPIGVQDLRRATTTSDATGMTTAGIIGTGTETIAAIDVTGTGMIAMTGGVVMVTGVGMDVMTTELGVNH